MTGAADTALVAQNYLLAAESIGLGGVYIDGIGNNPEQRNVTVYEGLP